MFFVRMGQWAPRTALALALMAGLAPAVGPQAAFGQPPIIAVGQPSFQTWAGPSYEAEVMERLALGQPAPGDLERLSRLTVLQSIALAATLQADQRNSPLAVRLEGEIAELVNLAEAFEESVSAPPAELAARSLIGQQLTGIQVPRLYDEAANAPPTDFQSLARSLELLAGVQRAFSTLESEQALLSGASPRVGAHLRGLARLIPALSSEMAAVEASAGFSATGTAGVAPTGRLAVLQVVQFDLAEVIRRLNEAPAVRPGQAALSDDMNHLFDLIQGFERLVRVEAPEPDLRAMFVPVLRRLRHVEAEAKRLDRSIAPSQEWRQARERIQAVAESFEIPRIVSPAAGGPPPAREDRALAAQIDRAVAELDAYLNQPALAADVNPPATELQSSVARLRLELLLFRQQIIASGLTARLTPRLREIQRLERDVSERTGFDRRVIRVGERPGGLRLEPVAAAIKALADSLSTRP
jgi:hypothetical protein